MRFLLYLLLIFSFGCSGLNHEKPGVTQFDSSANGNLTTVSASAKNVANIAPDSANVFLYDPSVSTVTGLLCKKDVSGVSSEEQNSRHKDAIIVVALQRSISVVNPRGTDTTSDENFPNEYNVDTMQLTIPGRSRDGIEKLIGHMVHVKGTLYHADNGSHFTNVLLYVQEIRNDSNATVMVFDK